MVTNSVLPSFPYWADADGKPLEAGYIYVGQPGLEARSAPKASFFDSGLTIATGTAVGSGVRTRAGYAVRNGSPAQIYVDGDFSVTVTTRGGVVVYSALNNQLALGFVDTSEVFPQAVKSPQTLSFIGGVNLVMSTGLNLNSIPSRTTFYVRIPITNPGPVTVKIDNVSGIAGLLKNGNPLPAGYLLGGEYMWMFFDGGQCYFDRRPVEGGNANGNYTQFEDGTMIARHRMSANAGADTTWTFPAPFALAPSVTATGEGASGVVRNAQLVGAGSTTGQDFNVLSGAPARTSGTAQLIAVGRWYT